MPERTALGGGLNELLKCGLPAAVSQLEQVERGVVEREDLGDRHEWVPPLDRS